VSISDIPSNGQVLGRAAHILVSLLHALHSFKGELVDSETLAREAVSIEREILKEPGESRTNMQPLMGI